MTATLAGDGGEQTVRAGYLIGADGAHSAVRKGLGLTFEGAAFEEQYMLGDVEVDWSMPRGYAIRAMHQTDGATDDLLVCIPLPGRGRYRMSMLVPDELSAAAADGDRARLRGRPQTRAAPHPGRARPAVARADHRAKPALVLGLPDQPPHRRRLRPGPGVRRGRRRAHPPADRRAGHEHRHPGRPQPGVEARAGGVRRAAPGLLDSYDAERRPVGEEVVGRTVRSAREGIGADSTDPDYVIRREAQLLINYADSPIVGARARAAAHPMRPA